jgi:hypothetical protein
MRRKREGEKCFVELLGCRPLRVNGYVKFFHFSHISSPEPKGLLRERSLQVKGREGSEGGPRRVRRALRDVFRATSRVQII